MRSTFIVGFPGERPEDVGELIDFLEEEHSTGGTFKYSDEDGTTAAKMPKKVDEEEIDQRHDVVMQTQAVTKPNWIVGLANTDRPRRRTTGLDTFACRHFGQASEVDNITRVSGAVLEVGQWATVTVTGTDGYDLVAEVSSSLFSDPQYQAAANVDNISQTPRYLLVCPA